MLPSLHWLASSQWHPFSTGCKRRVPTVRTDTDVETRGGCNGYWMLPRPELCRGAMLTLGPDICPATLQQLAVARSRVLTAGENGFPNIVLISVDPERDTPEVMANYVSHFGDGIIGVTGQLDELRKFTSALGIYFEKSVDESGIYSVDHSAVVIVVNRRAEFHALFSAPHKIDHFVNDLPLITGSR